VGRFVDLRDPFVHRVGPRLDTFEATVVQVFWCLMQSVSRDPIRVLFDRDRIAITPLGALRPIFGHARGATPPSVPE
jgi:hypothetical protein